MLTTPFGWYHTLPGAVGCPFTGHLVGIDLRRAVSTPSFLAGFFVSLLRASLIPWGFIYPFFTV